MLSPRLVATDLDGTLLRTGALLSPRTRDALGLVRAAGADIVFATARPPRRVDAIAAEAGVLGTAICSNGAIVYDLTARSIIRSYTLEHECARLVAARLAEALPEVSFAVETGEGVLFEAGYGKPRFPDVRLVASLWDDQEPIVKLLAWSARWETEEMAATARAAIGDEAEITYSGSRGLLEISAAGVTKAVTLAGICAERGIAATEVVAFGDMPNDLAVLLYAGAGYAMANSHHTVLDAVRRSTLSNDEDGVAIVLERLYAGG